MSLRNKLEECLDLLVNGEEEKASKIFREAFIDAAKSIHNEIMEEENWLDEMDDEMDDMESMEDEIEAEETSESQEFFTEDEMEDEEVEDAADDLEDDMEEVEDEDMDAEMADDVEVEDDMEVEGDVEEEIDQTIMDLKDNLADLEQRLEELKGGDVDDEEVEDFGDEEVEDEEVEDFGDEEVEDEEVEEFEESEEVEEEVEELDESFELEAVTSDNDWGKKTERQAGSADANLNGNTDSPLPKKAANADDAKSVSSKGDNHNGFDRETPPTKKDMPARKNNVSKADANMHKAQKDTGALLNKKSSDGFGAENTASPVNTKRKKTTK